MNIKLSKRQWEEVGKKSGWMKKEAQAGDGVLEDIRLILEEPDKIERIKLFMDWIAEPNDLKQVNMNQKWVMLLKMDDASLAQYISDYGIGAKAKYSNRPKI